MDFINIKVTLSCCLCISKPTWKQRPVCYWLSPKIMAYSPRREPNCFPVV